MEESNLQARIGDGKVFPAAILAMEHMEGGSMVVVGLANKQKIAIEFSESINV